MYHRIRNLVSIEKQISHNFFTSTEARLLHIKSERRNRKKNIISMQLNFIFSVRCHCIRVDKTEYATNFSIIEHIEMGFLFAHFWIKPISLMTFEYFDYWSTTFVSILFSSSHLFNFVVREEHTHAFILPSSVSYACDKLLVFSTDKKTLNFRPSERIDTHDQKK